MHTQHQIDRCRNALWIPVLACLAIFLTIPAALAEREFDGVLVQKSEIDGRVFVIAEEDPDTGEHPDPIPAERVRVDLKDRKDRRIIASTITDTDGRYKLSDIAPGLYKIHIGDLRLDFKVKPKSTLTGEEPRVFVVLLPEDLAPPAKARADD